MDPRKETSVNITGGHVNVSGDVVGGNKYVQEAPVPVIPALHQLPPPPRDFTGRDRELRELIESVQKNGVTISGIQGLGGVGKTALALKLADEFKSLYPDAQFYLDLKGVSDQPLSPRDAMEHVVRAYHPSARLPDDDAALSGLYHSVLHGQKALLLWDNARDEHQVEPLMPPPSCLMLVTSRHRFVLPGLARKDLDSLAISEAVDLLVRIAPRLAEEQKDVPVTLAELCSCLPLALRSVGSTLAARVNISPAAYLLKLADARERLKLTSVDASLRLSYQLLTDAVKMRFASLAVFPDSFSDAGASGIWGDTLEAAGDVLGELIAVSLLEFNTTTERYRLHDLVRVFADMHMEKPTREALQLTFSGFYCWILERSNLLYLEGNDAMRRALAIVDVEWLNIKTGFALAAERAAEDSMAAELSLGYPSLGANCLEIRLQARERVRWLEVAVKSAQKLNRRLEEAQHLGNLGIAYKNLGNYQRAIEFYEAALPIAREVRDRGMEASVLGNLGIAYRNLGKFARAREYQDQRLQIAIELGDRRGEALTLGNLGAIWSSQEEWHRAIECYEKALNVAGSTGDLRVQSSSLGSLGSIHAQLNEYDRALEYQRQGLQIARAIGDIKGQGEILLNMSTTLDASGDRRQAVECLEAAVNILEQIESPHAIAARSQLENWVKES